MANDGTDTNSSGIFMVFGEVELAPNYTVFGTLSEEGLKVIDDSARARQAVGITGVDIED